MKAIRATFPNSISPLDVQFALMEGLKNTANRMCNVVVVGHTDDEEITYVIMAEEPEDFYLIGFLASSLIRNTK